MSESYVIYLSSMNSSTISECYGYWTGKNYVIQGSLYPVTDSKVIDRTKKYSSQKRAQKALELCLNRGYEYVTKGWIKEVSNE